MAFGDARLLAAQSAQIIQLGAACLATAHDLDRSHQRTEDRKDALYTFAIRDFAHGEVFVDPGAGARNAHALEGLQALARLGLFGLLVIGELDDPDIHLECIAGAEERQLLAAANGFHLFALEGLDDVHVSLLEQASWRQAMRVRVWAERGGV